ncbi:MAG: hypothetical protein JXL84_17095 [Deltaproteobacteria bacterium]|nr:hypothetical protein [Deltaproteobacteria bacterium]
MSVITIHNEADSCRSGCKGVEVPMEEEVVALNAMRKIRNEAKVLKSRMESLRNRADDKADEELAALETEVERLRTQWQGWEQKRKKAARERMILLGHEEPDTLERDVC